MQTYGTILGQASNALFNDPARAAAIREDKFKKKLLEIEAKGKQDLVQQQETNKGVKEVQEIKNLGELANTQLTGDIQEGLRNSMIEENLSRVGLNEKIGERYLAEAGVLSSQEGMNRLDTDIKSRYGMDLAKAQVTGQETVNAGSQAKVDFISNEVEAQKAKMNNFVNPKELTEADLQSLLIEKKGLNGVTQQKEESPISISRTMKYLANPVAAGTGDILSSIGKEIKGYLKKKKFTY